MSAEAIMKKNGIIIGNWKMNKTRMQANEYIKELLPRVRDSSATMIGLAVPFTAIELSANICKDSNVTIGAQNMNNSLKGAFTGEIAAPMIKDSGAHFVILGHSERRQLFKESDEMIASKVKCAIEEKLITILCVGETAEERQKDPLQAVRRQLEQGLKEITALPEGVQLIIAYEPVWAIGSGKAATLTAIKEVHEECKRICQELLQQDVAVIYGGSVSPDNVASFIAKDFIDGYWWVAVRFRWMSLCR